MEVMRHHMHTAVGCILLLAVLMEDRHHQSNKDNYWVHLRKRGVNENIYVDYVGVVQSW